ncbi:MAG: 3-phenylpropionate/cinnamic acid dioxygenase small subunit [Cycloclasticus pugetii]|jgi:3-phenylpropionate/cinnamic acid dioxygenase small subunit|uniref:aromatic-ring-hydroxylating dioxygenase subunit beta n=1 Tax=Cycloclasticus TaxID=34067 RepID=UPI00257B53B4|nr:aromatic-ring-hydroxylating dioxygenase subunit beta [Cycloclasticus sp.]MBV1898814.1 nuclear transport factor 2 family protein [Cycloclasticus sp.]
MDLVLKEQAIDVIINEAAALDHKQWDDWINLYTKDATYWMPSWIDEYTQTSNPKREISLIYYGNRSGLEDRVYRIRTELAYSASPLPRTCHMNSNFRVSENDEGEIVVHSSWVTHSYHSKVSRNAFGVQEHRLRKVDGELKICYRKITLHNDVVDTVLDVYSV